MNNPNQHIKTYPAMDRQDLMTAYGISRWTLTRWLKQVPKLHTRYVRQFKPIEVKRMIEHWGEPPYLEKIL